LLIFYQTIQEVCIMSEFNNLKLDIAEQIAVLTISRPAALNALNSETLDELNVALTEIEAMDNVKVVILTGGPDKKGNEFKSFVAGADIAEMVNFTAAEARAFGMRASVPFFKLQNMRQVTIAAVNGFALGGGCEISMACDIRIASDNATFGQPETGLGIIPGFGGTQRLARLVGMGRAKEMIFTCDSIDAAEAYRIGLVNKVVAPEELMSTAKAMAAKIISKGSYAVSVAKAAINNGYDMDIRNAVEMEANLFGVTCSTNDKKEGMSAFLERRAANLTDF
jgi:enoyl-CoA hydratase